MWGKEVENHWSIGKTRALMALLECAMESVTTVHKNVTIAFRRRKKYSGACSRYEEINTNDNISIIQKVTLGDQQATM